MPSPKRRPSRPSQPSGSSPHLPNSTPQPPQRWRSDEYSMPLTPFFSLQTYLSNPRFCSLVPFGLQNHIIHIVRTSERKPPEPEEPLISVSVNSRPGKRGNKARTEVRCYVSDTVGEFKRKAAAQLGLRYEAMVLRRYQGEPTLNDALTLEDYEIDDGSSLDVEVSTGDSLDSEVGECVAELSRPYKPS